MESTFARWPIKTKRKDKTRTVFSALKSSICCFETTNEFWQDVNNGGARDSEKKIMVASIVYTVYVTEKRGNQVNIDKKNLILQLFQFINLFAAVKYFLENSKRNHLSVEI